MRPVVMGVKQAIRHTLTGVTARLSCSPAGATMPDRGKKLTLVLRGAFQDHDVYIARGDIEITDKDLHHIPVADIHENCIFLAVTDAPLQFKGLLPRIWQKFARI